MLNKILGSEWLRNVQDNFDKIEARMINRGVHNATANEAAANTLSIPTGNADFTAWIVQAYRSGVNVSGDAVITKSGASLVVSDGSTYSVTENDLVHWIVF